MWLAEVLALIGGGGDASEMHQKFSVDLGRPFTGPSEMTYSRLTLCTLSTYSTSEFLSPPDRIVTGLAVDIKNDVNDEGRTDC